MPTNTTTKLNKPPSIKPLKDTPQNTNLPPNPPPTNIDPSVKPRRNTRLPNFKPPIVIYSKAESVYKCF